MKTALTTLFVALITAILGFFILYVAARPELNPVREMLSNIYIEITTNTVTQTLLIVIATGTFTLLAPWLASKKAVAREEEKEREILENKLKTVKDELANAINSLNKHNKDKLYETPETYGNKVPAGFYIPFDMTSAYNIFKKDILSFHPENSYIIIHNYNNLSSFMTAIEHSNQLTSLLVSSAQDVSLSRKIASQISSLKSNIKERAEQLANISIPAAIREIDIRLEMLNNAKSKNSRVT